MLKSFDKLWVFGDSYTTPGYCVEPQDSFWWRTADLLNANTIENCSWPRNSFASVCHMVVSLQQQICWDKDFLLIGMPPLERLTVFDNYKDTQYQSSVFDTKSGAVESNNIRCHTGLTNMRVSDVRDLVNLEDRAWTETQALRELFLLTTWLDSVDANYLIVNLSKPLDANNLWGPTEFLLPYCTKHNKCAIFDDTYYSVNIDINPPTDFDQFGWAGHHGTAGNQFYFEKALRQKLC